MDTDHLIILLTADPNEGAALASKLNAALERVTVALVKDAQSASLVIHENLPATRLGRLGRLPKDRLACLIVDATIYNDPEAAELLSFALKERSATATLSLLVIHYCSLPLRHPGFPGNIPRIDMAEIDTTSEYWPVRLCDKIAAYLFGREFLYINDSLNTRSLDVAAGSTVFPVYRSVTSDLQEMKELTRIFWHDSSNQDARTVAQYFFDIPYNGPLRFCHTPALRNPGELVTRRHHSKVRECGPFDVRWLPQPLLGASQSYTSESDADHYIDVLCELIQKNLDAGINCRDPGKRTPDARLFSVWLLNEEDAREPWQRLWIETPFLDSAEDFPILVCSLPVNNGRAMTRELLNVAVRHELMHILNREDRGWQIGMRWIWFDEALANWFALRLPEYEQRSFKIQQVPIDAETNWFGGLAFAQFIETQYGPQSLTRIWRTAGPSVFTAAEYVFAKAASALLLEFFLWAFRENLLTESHLGMDGQLVLNHASYALLTLDDYEIALHVSPPCGHWQKLYFAAFEDRHSIPYIWIVGCSDEVIRLPNPCTHLLIVNAVTERGPNVLHDEAIIQLSRRGISRSAGA